jgi:D-alanyl-D-alanine carboxypeptidase
MKLSHDAQLYLTGGLAIAAIIAATALATQKSTLESEFDARTQSFQATITTQNSELATASSTIRALSDELEMLRDDLEDLADDYEDEQNRNEEFEDQIRDLAGTLGDLDKLSQIDEELLAKYSKVYFLNENYTPTRLKQIDDDFIAPNKSDLYFHRDAYKHLEDLMEAAERADIDLNIVSAYRSFDEQTQLKGQYTQVYGNGANAFSADQGYSEHQLGTTVDFSSPAVSNGLVQSFDQTEAFAWLEENAHRYGFVLSYPEENGFYIYEPWHWRFVSVELARDLERRNDTFYEMDQREINEYLLEFFD